MFLGIFNGITIIDVALLVELGEECQLSLSCNGRYHENEIPLGYKPMNSNSLEAV